MPYDPKDYDASSVKLDRFVEAARNQIGDTYRFGAEAAADDANPTAFDSSELVEWAAEQAGFHDMPDGSWNQYRYLHDAGAAVPVAEALQTRGALVFGFSSDPLDPDGGRPTRAYVGISLGNGKVLDVSERAGEVREMDPGNLYGYGATIPEFHAVDDSVPPPDLWPDRDVSGDPLGLPGGAGTMPQPPLVPVDPDPVDPRGQVPTGDPADPVDPGPQRSIGPNGRILHQQFPGDEQYPDGMPPTSGPVCYPDDEAPPEPPPPTDEGPVCYPDDDGGGPTSQAEPLTPAVDDAPTYADASGYGSEPGYSTYPDDYGDLPVDV